MFTTPKSRQQTSLFFELRTNSTKSTRSTNWPKKINLSVFDQAFEPLYSHENGRPAKPIRLMVGLLILKYLRSVLDESVVEQWS